MNKKNPRKIADQLFMILPGKYIINLKVKKIEEY